ncbi:hypothetical protein BSKO_06405 [Bryopsis sp. KO-2023]|nr:hypothetical protein BSKO_06405 [Bryopsis sp. KO-2023]
MTSSFARLLGASPSAFSLNTELRISDAFSDRSPRTTGVEVDWTDDERVETVASRVVEALTAAQSRHVVERCSLTLQEEEIPDAALFPFSQYRVRLAVERTPPSVYSLEFVRQSGGAANVRTLVDILNGLDITSVRRLKAGPGFAFFLPGVVDVGCWEGLYHLNLSNSGLTHLPESLGDLPSLKELRLSSNKLSTLPRGLGNLTKLRTLILDHNQLVTLPAGLCQCLCLEELNLESNKISTPVLDLKRLKHLKSLQLFDNPLEYLPELLVCEELRSLSFMNLRVWSDKNFSRFEVELGGGSRLSRGSKLGPLFAILFRRSGSQHPLIAGALARMAEFPEHCRSIVKEQTAVQQLILMASSDNAVVQVQAAQVIGQLVGGSLMTEEFVRSDVLGAMLVLMKSDKQEIQLSGLRVISTLVLTSDAISESLLTPGLLEKLQSLIQESSVARVRHLGLEVLGNLGFAAQNKVKMLAVDGLLGSLIRLAEGDGDLGDRVTRICAKRALAILGQNEEVGRIVGRGVIRGRGVRVLSLDGGGMKGIATVMVLRELERRTGQRIFDLFDLIGGTSTGAMLACEIGLVNFSMDQCGKTYKTLGGKVFSQAENEDQSSWKESLYRMYRSGQQGMRIAITGCKHDPTTFESLLREFCKLPSDDCYGDRFIDSACIPCPKVFGVSTLSSVVPAVPFLFRNYEFPPEGERRSIGKIGVIGSSKYKIWQGVRASSAAPYYLDDFHVGGCRFQDGATVANNPAAVAVQQASLLWPGTPIDCVVSVGVGVTPVAKREKSSTTFIENGSVLLESACNVERVDEVLSTVLPMVPGMKYFRFCATDNRCDMALDNVDPEAWEKLEAATGDYLESVSDSLDEAAAILLSGIDTSRVHRSTPKEVRLGPRKGLVVVDCPTPACKWGKDVATLCSALEHTVLRVNLGACVETDSVGENGYVKLREASLTDWVFDDAGKGKREAGVEEQDTNGQGTSPMKRDELGTPSVFKGWSPAGKTERARAGFNHLYKCLSTMIEKVGMLHFGASSVGNGDQLVLNWETSLMSILEPSTDATALLAKLNRSSSHRTLSSLFSQTQEIFAGGNLYRCLSINQVQLSSNKPVRSCLIEQLRPREKFSSSDVKALGSMLAGVIVVLSCNVGEQLTNAFLESGCPAVVRATDSPVEMDSDAVVEYFQVLYKRLREGGLVSAAIESAERAVPTLREKFAVYP